MTDEMCIRCQNCLNYNALIKKSVQLFFVFLAYKVYMKREIATENISYDIWYL